MKVQKTPLWYYPIACVLGLFFGFLLVRIDSVASVSLLGVSWIAIFVLLIIGLAIAFMAYRVHKYATTKPQERTRHMDPKFAVLVLGLAKSLALVGAFLAGFYAIQSAVAFSHVEIMFFQLIVGQTLIASLVSLLDCILGIVSERWCQLPPEDGADNPQVKNSRQQRLSVEGYAPTKNIKKSH